MRRTLPLTYNLNSVAFSPWNSLETGENGSEGLLVCSGRMQLTCCDGRHGLWENGGGREDLLWHTSDGRLSFVWIFFKIIYL